ncbi:MAG TPA: hypothetical protein VIW46_05270 [Acidimicrobiia bacterium]
MDRDDRPNRNLYRALWIMLGLMVIATAVAMASTDQAPTGVPAAGSGRFGYTISLVLFLVPVSALVMWFARTRASIDRHWTAFWITFGAIVGLWSALDILLARTFFTFPNAAATLGIDVIGYDPVQGWGAFVPVEEFLFYILGSAFIVLTYIWASEYWFPAHTLDRTAYEEAAQAQRLGALFDPRVLVLGVLIVVGAVALKAWNPLGEAVPGFPGYITFMTVMVIVPTTMFLHVILRFVNLRAMVFTLQSMLLIALLWEVTLALPYGWWNYQHSQMIGIFVTPWSNLPIEAVLLWGAATWSNIAVYEVAKLFVHHRKRAAPQGSR